MERMTDTTEFVAPSGAIYHVRPVSELDALYDGTLVDPLAGMVEAAILARDAHLGGGLSRQTADERAKAVAHDPDDGEKRMRHIVSHFVVRPVLARDIEHAKELRTQGHTEIVRITSVPQHDFYALFNAALGDAAAVARIFRLYEQYVEAQAALGVASGGQDLRDRSGGDDPDEPTVGAQDRQGRDPAGGAVD